jgi:Ca2+-binding EF-hand superfamily protein
MMRYLAGVASALLLMAAAMIWWRGTSRAENPLPAPIVAERAGAPTLVLPVPAMPPQATEKTREEKRFSRYDKDKDGAVARDEYLAARHKAFAKLDHDGNGQLSFEEYTVKTAAKFAAADKDRSGVLTAEEFATTRVLRKSSPRNCLPSAPEASD